VVFFFFVDFASAIQAMDAELDECGGRFAIRIGQQRKHLATFLTPQKREMIGVEE
jgi:hypothetical protein